MKESCKKAFAYFVEAAGQEISGLLKNMDYAAIERAADVVEHVKESGGRVHVSGIGKPAHIAGYYASLLSSTGTPSYFLHGTEAVHGSCGQLQKGDVVFFISNSGETAEMKSTVLAILNNGCSIIGVSGNAASWLAAHSEVHLLAGVAQEGDSMNRAPRLSIGAELLVLQAVSILLQENAGITPQQYVTWHPGGKLGELRAEEKQ